MFSHLCKLLKEGFSLSGPVWFVFSERLRLFFFACMKTHLNSEKTNFGPSDTSVWVCVQSHKTYYCNNYLSRSKHTLGPSHSQHHVWLDSHLPESSSSVSSEYLSRCFVDNSSEFLLLSSVCLLELSVVCPKKLLTGESWILHEFFFSDDFLDKLLLGSWIPFLQFVSPEGSPKFTSSVDDGSHCWLQRCQQSLQKHVSDFVFLLLDFCRWIRSFLMKSFDVLKGLMEECPPLH